MSDHRITPRSDALAAAIIALLLVLTAPLAAEAECAWVLWLRLNDSKPWFIQRAFKSKEECEAVEPGMVRSYVTQYAQSKVNLDIASHCLPSDTDPRGPKGGAR